MRRSVSFRSSLLSNLMVVIVLLSGAIILTTYVGSRHVVRTLARSLIGRTMDEARLKMEQFFGPVTRELQVARAWGEAGLLRLDDSAALHGLFVPLIEEHPQVSSLLVADGRGREYMLLRTADGWLSRQTRAEEWGGRVRIEEWAAGSGPVVSERELGYDPRERPWYRGAIARRAAAATEEDPDAAVHWTAPYTLFATNEPGITAAVTFDARDGLDHVIGFEILLHDISAFTTALEVGEGGKLFVLTDDGRVAGLPSDPRFEDPASRAAALLRGPAALGVPVVADAIRVFEQWPTGRRRPARFTSDGESWWAQAQGFRLSAERVFRIAVAVPEAELLGGLRQERAWIILITLAVLAVAVLQAVTLSRRYSRPIEALARLSDRISQGELRAPEPLRTSVKELQRLADAHERMRQSLRSLLRLKGDLQLARQIQQSTFPERLPEIRGFTIDAWSEPAAETGGDTYDVIPRRDPQGGLTSRAVFLLADATGHGIGPALSVTQVRAMLRIAVRMGGGLLEIAQHLNDQLCADLPAGPFITAWLGELDGDTMSLTSFSAGQAPILRYRAEDDDFDVLRADAIPFGIVREMAVRIADPLPLGPGDIVAVISDGILEARNADRRHFGADRAMAVIRTHRRGHPTEIISALRAAVEEFTEGAPPGDDRTAIVIRRTER